MNNKTQSTIIAALMLTMFGQGCMKVELSPLDTNSATGVVAAAAPQILAMPTISYTGSPFTLPVNQSATLVPDVTGAPTSCASDVTLPAGLTLDNLTCKITGSPTTVQTAASYTITASNDKGSASAVISIAVIATGTAPTLSYSGSPYTLYTGTAITPITPTVTGAPTSCTSGTTLPAGLTIDNLSCVISGTPTIFKAAATYVITATNALGNAVANIIIKVLQQMGGALQGLIPNFATVSTPAGTPPGTNGTGTAAMLYSPRGSVVVGPNLYTTDNSGHTIRKIVIATGAVTTIAGQASVSGAVNGTGTAATFYSPADITSDGTNLYVADRLNGSIRKIVIATQAVTTLATGLSFPSAITTDNTNLFVAETGGNRVSMVPIATGIVTIIAGSGIAGYVEGTGTAAQFSNPNGIATDGTSLYVADTNNKAVRKISNGGAVSTLTSANAVVTTFAGGVQGYLDGIGTAAKFNIFYDITCDGTKLYVADTYNYRIRQIVISTAAVTTLAGSGVSGYLDATGTAAKFDFLYGISTDNTNLYVSDSSIHTIRKIVISTAVVTTLAGKTSTDGTGTAAAFASPSHVTTDGINLYVAEDGSHTIRKIVIATGAVSTLAGQKYVSGTTDGTGTAAAFNTPYGITTDGLSLYVTDAGLSRIRKITPASGTLAAMTSANAVVSTLAGAAGGGYLDGTGTIAKFWLPYGITTDGLCLYVADYGNNKIRKICPSSGTLNAMTSATAAVSTLAGAGAGYLDATGTAALFYLPYGITTDGSSLYIADTWNNRIRTITPSSGTLSAMTSAETVVTTLAGAAQGELDGTGTAATFFLPMSITCDGTNLYVTGRNNIRKIVISTAVVSTLAGAAVGGYLDGAIATARFYAPVGLTTDGVSLYVTDAGNRVIRKLQ